jgi:hypothetical protein
MESMIELKNVGVLLCAHSCERHLEECLRPWLNLGANISAVSVPFEEYKGKNIPDDRSQEILQSHGISFFDAPKFIPEAQARNMPLNFLRQQEVELVWLLDGDEIYTEEEIENILAFVNNPINKFNQWFRVNFKNYVFDGKKWIDGFHPPRIYRMDRLGNFYWDNDIDFYPNSDNVPVKQEKVANTEIPRSVAHVRHMTWLNTPEGKRKVLYQEEHFSKNGKNCCSYSWDSEKDCLTLNRDFYKHHKVALPELRED